VIPLVDLGWQHEQIKAAVVPRLEDAMRNSNFILGPAVREFEESFANYAGIDFCVGVGSGTDALELAIRSLDLPMESEIIVPTNSFIASASAVVRAGHRPVLVDVDAETSLIDLESIERQLSPRTGAVMPVHLYGRLVPLAGLSEMAKRRGFRIIEDAAQSHGARTPHATLGTYSDVVATSFYPGKNLGAYGDGGAVLTNDTEIAERVRRLRDHGSTSKYQHVEVGTNSRLDALQAVVLSEKLRHLDHWNKLRRNAAERYDELLRREERIRRPEIVAGAQHVWHLYVIQVSERDSVLAHLNQHGVGAGIHYPVPIHLQPAMTSFIHSTPELPVAERLANSIISLPLYPGLSEGQQEHVVELLIQGLQ
jgi:dTDP-4-amino-4,6-dideoxygalactose transaminase